MLDPASEGIEGDHAEVERDEQRRFRL